MARKKGARQIGIGVGGRKTRPNVSEMEKAKVTPRRKARMAILERNVGAVSGGKCWNGSLLDVESSSSSSWCVIVDESTNSGASSS